jgi:hypothetical protein
MAADDDDTLRENRIEILRSGLIRHERGDGS